MIDVAHSSMCIQVDANQIQYVLLERKKRESTHSMWLSLIVVVDVVVPLIILNFSFVKVNDLKCVIEHTQKVG